MTIQEAYELIFQSHLDMRIFWIKNEGNDKIFDYKFPSEIVKAYAVVDGENSTISKAIMHIAIYQAVKECNSTQEKASV